MRYQLVRRADRERTSGGRNRRRYAGQLLLATQGQSTEGDSEKRCQRGRDLQHRWRAVRFGLHRAAQLAADEAVMVELARLRRAATGCRGQNESRFCLSDARWRGGQPGSNRMQVEQEDSAVRMVVSAGSGLCLQNWPDTMQVFLVLNQRGVRQVGPDEVAFVVHVGIDGVIDQMPALAKFDGDVVGRGARPDRSAVHCVIGFPDAKVMTPRHDCAGLGQGIRVVLNSAEHVKPGHHQLPSVRLDPTSALKGCLQIVFVGDEHQVNHVAFSPLAIKDTWRQILHHGIQPGSGLPGARQICRQYSRTTVDLCRDLRVLQNSTGVTTRQQENRRSRKIEQGRDGHLPYHAPGVRGSLDFPACAQADRLTVDQFDGIKIEDYVAPDSEKAPAPNSGDRTLCDVSRANDCKVSDLHVLFDCEKEGLAGTRMGRGKRLRQPQVNGGSIGNDQAGRASRGVLGEQALRQKKQQEEYVYRCSSVMRKMQFNAALREMVPHPRRLNAAYPTERCVCNYSVTVNGLSTNICTPKNRTRTG